MLRGTGKAVEVDNCRVDNWYRVVKGARILGMIDPNTRVDIEKRGEVFVTKEQLPQKIKVMLLPIIPIILKHVKSDTIIVTVLWKSYFGSLYR